MNQSPYSLTKFEQSAVVISTETTRIAIDFGNCTESVPSIAHLDGLLVSHVHPDHFHIPHIDAFGVPVWAAAEAAEQLAATGRCATVLMARKDFVIGDIEIDPIDVDHGPLATSISNLGFFIRAAGHLLLFAGDMQVALPKPPSRIDALLIPVGGSKVFDPAAAATYVRNIAHRGIVVPLHYHGKADRRSAKVFRSEISSDADVHVLDVGQTLEVVP